MSNCNRGGMKVRTIYFNLWLVIGVVLQQGAAFAHGTEMHGKMKPADARMKKLHAMMPMFSLTAASLEAALEKGDKVAVEAEAAKIVTALPDLKKSQPHKNVNRKKKFIDMATGLETAVTTTANLAKNGDFVSARDSFKRVEAACAACHAKFRD